LKEATHNHRPREARIELDRALQLRNLRLAEGDVERSKVGDKVLDLAAAEDGEDVWRFGEDVGDCDCVQR
jgi:hypothetical protein